MLWRWMPPYEPGLSKNGSRAKGGKTRAEPICPREFEVVAVMEVCHCSFPGLFKIHKTPSADPARTKRVPKTEKKRNGKWI